MDPISNVDQLVLLLRQRLTERAKAARPAGRAAVGVRTPETGVQALAALGDLSERQFRRALVQNLLAERLDRSLLNEAGFQQVVDQVVDALEQDEFAARTLERAVAELRAASR